MLLSRMSAKLRLPAIDEPLPGRGEQMPVPARHAVTGAPLKPPFGDGIRTAVFALGCFWGAERLFWELQGVVSTAAGYTGGVTPNPTYEEVCSGRTGHAEAVLVAYDPAHVGYEELLRAFWEGHDPTQGMRQGNDVGTQYRSAIYFDGEQQRQAALVSRERYQGALRAAGRGEITTEIAEASLFHNAEEHHQQYLHKVPHCYCGLGGTGVSCPAGVVSAG